MADDHRSLLAAVEGYYSGRLREHGPGARGVDWNSEASQELRFEQLLKVCDRAGEGYVLNDYGCGYGALLGFLLRQGRAVTYRGCDISAEMVRQARMRHAGVPAASFAVAAAPDAVADFTVASGLFNVKLEASEQDWQRYVLDTVDTMDRCSRRGFAFNCLTQYSDPERMRADLHYADPCLLFDRCKRRYSRDVALLHDYGLYEFTILVRKDV
jgi:SAM-dependent methyltransferase